MARAPSPSRDHESGPGHDHDHAGAPGLDPAALSRVGQAAAEFAGRRIEWIAGPPVAVRQPGCRALLVHIFDFASLNCVRTLPYFKAWHERYAPDGLVVAGIHVPEFPFGADAALVRAAVRDLGIPYPVVSDPGLELMAAWRNVFWPRTWVVGADGIVRADHIGEGGYDELEAAVRRTLGSPSAGRRWPEIMDPVRPEDAPGAVCYPRSDELSLGHERGVFGGPHQLEQGLMHVYRDAPRHVDGAFYLTGAWEARADCVRHGTPPAPGHPDTLKLRFHGSEVHAVLGSETGRPVEAGILLDGKHIGTVTAGSPNLHRLVALPSAGHHELALAVTAPGFCAWTFAFGSPVVPRR